MRTGVPMLRRWLHTIFASRHTKKASVFLLFLVVFGLFLWVDPVSAETYDQFKNSILGAMSEFFLGVSSFFIQLTLFCLKFFILVAGYNGFIEADVVKFGWNIVRDVANMFFVVILLVIAFGTILGLEQYEWRKSMVKLVFAAIFVNFSNVICQLIIDVAQVFTVTFLNAVAGTAAGNLIQMLSLQSVFQLVRNGSAPGSESLPVLIVVSSLFALLFSIMAAVSIGSYMIVMLYRLVVLWCLIILSPLAFIFSILPTTKSYADEFWKEFTNHVIAAPVMVFFLWLAFSTFGAGDVVQSHIQQHSLPGMTISEPGQELGLTASAASSFSNLANFAVAVAFLFMGLERVQKLGVKGGDYVQRGMDFGKKVFTIASGVALGQAAYNKVGVPSAKFVANKFPAIGGDAWRRRGKSIKGASKIAGAWVDTKRDNLASKLEGKGLGLGTAASWVVQSGARAEKISSNWEKAGEDARKRWDETVSTSNTLSGKSKLTQGVKLEIVQELSQQKKAKKFAEERDRLSQDKEVKGLSKIAAIAGVQFGNTKVGDYLKTRKRDKAEKRKLKESNDAENEKRKAAIRESRAKDLGIDFTRPSEYGNILQDIATGELKAAVAKAKVDQAQAGRKDKALGSVLKQAPRFQAAFLESQQKALEEQLGSLNYREATKTSGRYSSELKSKRNRLGNIDPKDFEEASLIGKNLAASLTSNLKKGSEQGMAALKEALASAGWNDADEARAGNSREGMQQKLLSALLGTRVTNAQDGFDDFIKLHGESSNAILKQLDGALKTAATDGAVNLAGLFDDREVDPSDNRIKYKLESDPAEFESSRDYFAQEISGAINKLTGIGDIVGRDSADAKKFALDPRSIKQMVEAMGSLTPQTRLNSRLLDSLKKLRTDTGTDFDQFLKELKNHNAQAEQALKARLGIP